MDENFLMKFIGKDIAIVPFSGALNVGVRGKVVSVGGTILCLAGDGDDVAYIDIDGIMAIIPFGEAIQDEN